MLKAIKSNKLLIKAHALDNDGRFRKGYCSGRKNMLALLGKKQRSKDTFRKAIGIVAKAYAMQVTVKTHLIKGKCCAAIFFRSFFTRNTENRRYAPLFFRHTVILFQNRILVKGLTERDLSSIINPYSSLEVTTLKKHTANHAGESIYGEMPPAPKHLHCVCDQSDPTFAAGYAVLSSKRLIIDLGESRLTLPFISSVPNHTAPCPAIVNLSFDSAVPNKFLPAEEINERGYAIFHLNLSDVSENNGDFKSGAFSKSLISRRRRTAAGKTALWSWAALRLIEYVSSLENIRKDAIAVAGHGISAISAMLSSCYDGKSSFVIANDPFSALSDGSTSTILSCLWHLFCPAFVDQPTNMIIEPLLSSMSGVTLLLGSARDREFADVEKEARLLENVSDAYHFTRDGLAYFSRKDWNNYLDFIDSKLKN